MTTPNRTCTSCAKPIPPGASFCELCGGVAPTEISSEAETLMVADKPRSEDQENRERLQRAMGNGFELREVIGSGGFGSVYAAWDKELERIVAVKTLRYDFIPTRELVDRFRREARAAAKLRHPNILPIYSVGGDEDSAFFTMPLIEGESLAELIAREGPLPESEARRILIEVGSALAKAHSAGFAHRDIKPANILLEGSEKRALLMDFGIAKAVSSESTQLTLTGMVIGTPRYMSPEQARGDKEVGTASDIYSLGVVAFEMLTGNTPFSGNSLGEIIAKHLTEEPADLAETQQASSALSALVMTCLQKTPSERWKSAGDFTDALQALEKAESERRTIEEKGSVPSEHETVGRRSAISRIAMFSFVLIPAVLVVLAVALTSTGNRPRLFHRAGTVLWKSPGRFMSDCPAIGPNGTLYLSSLDRRLYAIRPDGTQYWQSKIPTTISSPAISATGTIYVGSADSSVYALSPDGTTRWRYETGGPITSSPALGLDGTVYAASRDSTLHAISANGSPIWRFDAGGEMWGSPALGLDGTLYFGATDGRIYAISPEGDLVWAFTTRAAVTSSPALGLDGTVYVNSRDENLYAINADGTQKWAYNAGIAAGNSPVIGPDETIYIVARFGRDALLTAMNLDGSLKWSLPLGGRVDILTPVIGSDGTIYVVSNRQQQGDAFSSDLIAVKPDGTEKWRQGIRGQVRGSLTIGADGTLYQGTHSGLFAFKSSSRGLSDSPWPKLRRNLQNTGNARTN